MKLLDRLKQLFKKKEKTNKELEEAEERLRLLELRLKIYDRDGKQC